MTPPHNPLASLSHAELMGVVGVRDAQLQAMKTRIEELTHRVKWFETQLFGSRAEGRILKGADARQLFLGEMLEVPADPPAPGTTVKAYERSQRKKPTNLVGDGQPSQVRSRRPSAGDRGSEPGARRPRA